MIEIEISCPECGGSQIWQEQQRLKRCEFCGSMLYFEHDLEQRFYLEPRLKTQEDLRQALIFSKAEQIRAEKMGRYPTGNDDRPLEMLTIIDVPLAPYLQEAEEKLRIHSAHLLFAPYWHFQATVYQCVLAVDSHENKEYSMRRVPVDEATPGYREDQWNFRDRGLRFGEGRFKEATTSVLGSWPHIEFAGNPDSHFDRIVQSKPIAAEHSSHLFKFFAASNREKLPVYRPYWFVNYECGLPESALVDACYGTVAAHLRSEEAEKVSCFDGKPYAQAIQPKLRIISSRCPVCGFDSNWGVTESIRFCQNCGRALSLDSGEIGEVPYQYAPEMNRSFVYLPFWKFAVELNYRNHNHRALDDYFALFFPDRMRRGRNYGSFLWIPACRIKENEKGDELFSALIADACCTAADLLQGPRAQTDRIFSAELSRTGACEILPYTLPSASGISPTLHKSSNLTAMLKETKIRTDSGTLALLCYPVETGYIIVGKQRFALPLLQKS